MKVALVYTSTTPELIELVEKGVGDVLPWEAEAASYQDPPILAEVRDAGYVIAPPAARLAGTYMTAVPEGADAILNLCSSVGEVADTAQDTARYTGIPITCVDEGMCREVARQGKRVGVMATLPTTLNPTKNIILRVVRGIDCQVEPVDALADSGFGLDQEQFKVLISEYAGTITDKVDAILFARGSTAYCEEYIREKYGKVVLFSPRFGAAALKDAFVKRGLV